jgi:hypothetical protein
MTRGILRGLARGLIGVLLFAQVAVAAYACPGLAAKAPDAAVVGGDMAMDEQMPGCDDMAGAMDPESANLCAEHCKQGKQSDQAPTLTVPAAMLAALYTTTPALPAKAVPRPAAGALSALVAASPPHAILHCVYRI